jgi:N-acyl-D-amino-acid deacylase
MRSRPLLALLVVTILIAASLFAVGRDASAGSAQETTRVDLLIRRGKVIDGSGSAAIQVDIGIKDDRIIFVGDAAKFNISIARQIDASGLVVAPGFIDPHTHAMEDLSLPATKWNKNYLMQGVTTVITGNDGQGPIHVQGILDKWQQQGIGTNAALLVGQGTIRREVMAMSDGEPSPEQLERMKAMVGRAMDEGAYGMSTGLYYAPGSYAKTEEVIELAKVAARKGGIYDSHMRDESSYTTGLLGSIKETIRIAREAGIAVNISHIKALGSDVWGKSAEAIEMIKKARAEGLKVTADQYPYAASGTSVTAALVPRWAEVGGTLELIKRIADPALRPRLVAEMESNLRRRGGADSLLITSANDHSLEGKTLAEIARKLNLNPVLAALELIKAGGAGVASFSMSEKDIENFMKQDFVMTGSDGSNGHPRKYGTYPRKLREYVYKKKLISLPFAIRHSSALVAETFLIRERGLIREGFYADIIVFDEKTVADRATYKQPELLATGMKYVIVNGEIAVDEGRHTGALAGRALRKN